MENRDFIPITTFFVRKRFEKMPTNSVCRFFPGPTHFSVSTRSIYLFLFFNLRHTVNTLGRNFLSSLALVGRLFSLSEFAIGELVGGHCRGKITCYCPGIFLFPVIFFFPPIIFYNFIISPQLNLQSWCLYTGKNDVKSTIIFLYFLLFVISDFYLPTMGSRNNNWLINRICDRVTHTHTHTDIGRQTTTPR